MKLLENFLTQSKNIDRDSKLWNMIASMFMAFQSVVTLIVMSHFVGPVAAGIYTMGNTDANLFLSVGKYNVRYFQVSDVQREFNFREYRIARIISCAAMALISTVYVLFVANANGYSAEKTNIIIWMCLYKLPDAFEDVYYGDYQKGERLDVASKAMALRLILTIIILCVIVIISGSLLKGVVISTIFSVLFMILLLYKTKDFITEHKAPKFGKALRLLLVTGPLALAGFLTIYISAAPRNSIDRYLDDIKQGIYGYISMPVFVVQLLVLFIFNPILYKISCMWDEGRVDDFVKESLKQMAYTIILTLVCIAGAWLLGIPVLSILYNTDLKPFKTDLMIMMVGSGFQGFIGLLVNLLTIMRHQNQILLGYAIVSVIGFLACNKAVQAGGIRGAVLIYLCLLIILTLIFAVEMIIGISQKKKMLNKVA